MQPKAEEKKKGYCCVVWCAEKLTNEMLLALEILANDGRTVDEHGHSCIEVFY
jgi:hypothetical protein